MTISGLPMNELVSGLPSLRLAKLRLNDVMIELAVPSAMSSRFHWPMQGPQALASTVAPISSRVASWPSRSMVALDLLGARRHHSWSRSWPRRLVGDGLRAMSARGRCPRSWSWCSEPMSAAVSSAG
jgi:hypothetical protein